MRFTFDVNALAHCWTAREFVPAMAAADHGNGGDGGVVRGLAVHAQHGRLRREQGGGPGAARGAGGGAGDAARGAAGEERAGVSGLHAHGAVYAVSAGHAVLDTGPGSRLR